MTTLNIIMAVCLIVLMGVAVWLVIRYMRKGTEVELRAQDLERQKAGLQKRHNALDNWEHQIKAQVNLLKKQQHVYSTVAVDDPDDTAPDFPDTVPFKKMKSQMGYYVVPKFRDHIIRSHKDGKTIYTLDLYVAPYNEQHGNA